MTLNERTTKTQTIPSELSVKGFVQLCIFEGCKLKAYKDAGGVWTIGYGHTDNVRPNDKISTKQASDLLQDDLKPIYNYLKKYNNLTQGNFDALTSFIFNIGITRFESSTLKKKIVANRTDPTIFNEFKKWIKCNGVVLNGLVKRRDWEAQRYYEKD